VLRNSFNTSSMLESPADAFWALKQNGIHTKIIQKIVIKYFPLLIRNLCSTGMNSYIVIKIINVNLVSFFK